MELAIKNRRIKLQKTINQLNFMQKERIDFIGTRSKSWHIFKGNYKDLCAECDSLQNPQNRFIYNNIEHIMDENMYLKMKDVERKFHNFLASAKTLVDHTRIHLKKHINSSEYETLNRRLDTIGKSPTVKFCHDLRNYFLHFENPVNNYYINQTWYENDNLIVSKCQVRISKDSLEKYKNWSKESKEIIKLLTEPLDVREIADVYYEEIHELNEWIFNEFSKTIGTPQ